jgi:GntR family transcriptional regulator
MGAGDESRQGVRDVPVDGQAAGAGPATTTATTVSPAAGPRRDRAAPAAHRMIADDLRRRIVGGDLGVGDPVPSEAILCRTWGTSRGPVRQALAALRAEGLIGGGRGRPPVVRTRAVAQPLEVFLSFSRWAGAVGLRPGQRTLEVARRPVRAEAADGLGLEVGESVVEVLRLRLLDGRPAMLERTTFVEPVGRLLFDFDPDSGSIYAHLTAHGVDLGRGRHTLDAVAAGALDAELLDVAPGAPLLRERRLAGPIDGEPCEYSDDRYRPDLVTFTIDNTARAAPGLLRTPTGSLTPTGAATAPIPPAAATAATVATAATKGS